MKVIKSLNKLLLIGAVLSISTNGAQLSPQIYVDIHFTGGLEFSKQIKDITTDDLSNFSIFDLRLLQQSLCSLISKIGDQFTLLNTKGLPSHIDAPLSIPHKTITSMSISESMTTQLKTSIEAIDETLNFISDPSNLSSLNDLPKQNKIILLDLTNRLVEEGQTHFSTLRDTLQKQISKGELLDFDTAADTINFGLQTDQNYEKYTQNDTKNLIHLIHCYVVCKGYKIQGLNPPIEIEDLQILIKKSIDYSGYSGCSEQLLACAKELELIMKE